MPRTIPKISKLTAKVFFAAASLSAVTAIASPLDVALPYNYFVLHNFSATADITGRIAAGGTIATGNTYGADIGLATDPYSLASYPITVYAAGGMAGSGYSNVQKGSEYVGAGPGNFNQNGGGTVLAGCGANCINFQTAATALTAYSTQLGTLIANGTVGPDTNPSFTALTGISNTLNVFTILASTFQSATLDIRTPVNSTTVVNVIGNVTGSGGALYINGNQATGTTSAGAHILFNFVGATSVNITNQFSASILAPLATYSSNAQVDGNVIVSAVTGSGETHDALFTGGSNLPAASVSTPEPVNFGVLGCGLLAIGFFGRKYSRKN